MSQRTRSQTQAGKDSYLNELLVVFCLAEQRRDELKEKREAKRLAKLEKLKAKEEEQMEKHKEFYHKSVQELA